MASRLLDRQVSLLNYLTSGAAIFSGHGAGSLDQTLHGFDRELLCLEARFSHEKRMEKIAAIFPRTFEILNGDLPAIVRAFVEVCPPVNIGRLENAQQFYDFFCARGQREPLAPPHLCDVIAFELACAQLRIRADASKVEAEGSQYPTRDAIRRHPGAVLLRCAYDIRSIFEAGWAGAVPTKRDTPLAIAVPPSSDYPRVFEIGAPVFDLLAALDDWIEPAEFGPTAELAELIHDFARYGLLEVSR